MTFDVHTHILTKSIYPKDLFIGRLSIPEDLVELLLNEISEHRDISKVVAMITKLIGGRADRIVQLVRWFQMDMEEQQKEFETQASGHTDIVCPLGLDLDFTANNFQTSLSQYIPMATQIASLSEWAKRGQGKVLPFFPVDPRRKGILEAMIKGLEHQGFMGIKMYPAMGWFPSGWDIHPVLRAIYGYCEDNRIPITVHCSAGGVHGQDTSPGKYKYWTTPLEWQAVMVEYPMLVVNLAHFGGQVPFENFWNTDPTVQPPSNWTWRIVEMLMAEYDNVFTDISFHDDAMSDEHVRPWLSAMITALSDGFACDRIMMGSDWPLHHTMYSYSHWVGDMQKLVGRYNWDLISNYNPRRFLFGESGVMPQRLTDFYKR